MRMFNIYNKSENDNILLEQGRESFEEYMNTTTNRTVLSVLYEGRHIECTLQDSTFNNRTYGDEKILLCRHNEALEAGDYLVWQKAPYLVTAEDKNTTQTHRTFIIRPCNNVVNIKQGDKIKPLYIIIDGSIPKYKENDTITLGNNEFRLVFGNNVISETIKEDQRLMIKEHIYRVMTLESITGNMFHSKGISFGFIKRELKTASDDVENGLAGNNGNENEEDFNDILDGIFGGGKNA